MDALLATFLNAHKATDKQNTTHTRIGSKEFNVYGGTYNITETDEETFYKTYYDNIIAKQNPKQEYLTEKQIENGVLAIDLDFHYDTEIETRQHDKSFVNAVIYKYVNKLKRYIQFEDGQSFRVYVMERPECYMTDIKTKDGIHLIFGLNLNRKSQIDLRNNMIRDPEVIKLFNELPLINTLDSVFDEGITKGTTNWNLYGSRKPAFKQYQLTTLYECQAEWCDGNGIQFNLKNIEFQMNYDLFKELVVRNTDRPQFNEKILPNADAGAGTISQSTGAETTEPTNDTPAIKREITLLLECIGDKRCKTKEYTEWFAVGQAIKNTLKEEGNDLFISWTHKYGTENKKQEAYNKIVKEIKYTNKKDRKRLTIASLHYWAKQDNPEMYQTHFGVPEVPAPEISEEDKKLFEDMLPVIAESTETNIAKFFVKLTGGIHKCVNIKLKAVYSYVNNVWKYNEGGNIIRTLITDLLGEAFNKAIKYYTDYQNLFTNKEGDQYDELKKKTNKLIDLHVLIGKTSWKNNILTEILDLIYDSEFEEKLNRKKNYLPIANGKLFNMITNQVEDRTITDYFTYECPISPVSAEALTDENYAFVEKYFNDLFCNNQQTKQTFINLVKSALSGNKLRYVMFLTGIGSNGKSLIMNVIKNIFSSSVDTISKEVIIKRENKSSITTEMEKLEKCRFGIASELQSTDRLNEDILKQISGGDAMNCRALYKADRTITPTTNIFMPTNFIAASNFNDKAFQNRVIIVPFNNVFTIDNTFEDKLTSRLNYIFTYIMLNGNILDKFELSEEMKLAKDDYINDNVDSLKQFCDENFVACENDATNKPIKMPDFRIMYNEWCKKMGFALDKRPPSTITKLLTAYGYTHRESNSIRRIYNVRFKDQDQDDEEED